MRQSLPEYNAMACPIRSRILIPGLLALCLLLLSPPGFAQDARPYLIGRGMADVTGPAVGVQFWGFGRADQTGEGLHTRLRSRAFIIAEAADPASRLVYVSADLGSIDHHITLEVVENIRGQLGDEYHLGNVIITATHTHSGPGGYWHSRSATGLDGGLYPQHFEAIVRGITESVVAAHNDLEPGNILINSGRLDNAGVNRSAIAYRENPAGERARYSSNTNTEMLLLKFVHGSGAIGMLNWYALHPTAMNFHNRLISGDHKGYAALQMELARGNPQGAADGFVAAFAQSDPGDVTPNTNLDNTGPGATDVETTRIMGERQLAAAERLFADASEALHGPIESHQIYVDLSDFTVSDAFTGSGEQRTCPSAYGYSFAGGSTEDGGAHFLFREGMTEQQAWRDWLIRFVTGAPKWTQAVRECQAPKPILFETGSGDPPLQSQVHPVSIARIGQLVILALPAEVTTMAGRRLRASVQRELGSWAQHVVLAGYANGYSGYITTPEEYMLQQYEAAHTLHGRWTLPAYQQVGSALARSLEHGAELPASSSYDDWRGKSTGKPLPVGTTSSAPTGSGFGAALPMEKSLYQPGDVVVAEFISTNPTAHFPAATAFLTVEHNTGSGWQAVATEANWSTRIRWREEKAAYIASTSWHIPADAAGGEYRITHAGFGPLGEAFTGASQTFRVQRN